MPDVRPYAGREGIKELGAMSEEESVSNLLNVLVRIATTVDEILGAILAEHQQGIVYSVTANVSSIVPVEIPFSPPLFALIVINDGPGVVQYRAPNIPSGAWVDLQATERVSLTFKTGVITSVAFRVTGAAANIRAIGTY